MAKIAKKTKRYPSDVTDEEWEQTTPLIPKPGRRGRPREVDFREVVNAVRYLVGSGCGWRTASERARGQSHGGRDRHPVGQAPQARTRGYDAGKKIVGRKRHIAVDTDGRLLMVNLTPAEISDSAGAQAILDGIRKRWPWVKHLFADGAYHRLKLMDKAAYLDFVIEIIRRSDDQKAFEVLPRRWVVERTFAWMTRWRRLVRDWHRRLSRNAISSAETLFVNS
ncbi:IS5 family transposase [Mesorhizobium sp. M1365]|uniref:IS5 family transposase n=1 Tax=Mesorhizobium sp. M1365 TaxID=2957090 RepID=UPI003339BC8D